MYLKKIIFLFFCLLFINGYSQKLKFKNIGNEEGLSSIYVNSIIQDDKGFMWFGTQDGLNRYDGYNVKVFKSDPTNPKTSLTSNEVTFIKQLKTDLFIIGTSDGFSLFNPYLEKFTAFKSETHIKGKINSIAIVNNTELLIASEQNICLFNLESKKFTVISFPLNEAFGATALIEFDKKIYIGTDGKGLWEYSSGKLKHLDLKMADFLSSKISECDNILSFAKYANRLYIGTKGFGVFKLDVSTNEIEQNYLPRKKKIDENSNVVTAIQITENTLYVSTLSGLHVFSLLGNDLSFSYLKNENEYTPGSISSNRLKDIYIDNNKNIWVATQLSGVDVNFKQSQRFNNPDYLDLIKDVNSIIETSKNSILVGGVRLLKNINLSNKTLTDYSKQSNNTNAALSLYKQNNEIIWIGTWGSGLKKFNIISHKINLITNSDFGGTILSLLNIGNNRLLAASFGDGLFLIDTENDKILTHFGKENGLPSLNLFSLYKDSKNNIWLGTYDAGLLKINIGKNDNLIIENTYKNDGHPNQIAGNSIMAINEDKNATIWIATSTGLSKLLPDGSFYNFFEKNGLPNTYLYSILSDSLNNFWMSSNSGLIKFNPLLQEKDIAFKNYTLKDGLLNKEFNSGAYLKLSTGEMVFGGVNGINIFNPNKIKDNLNVSSPQIVSYKRSGKDVKTDTVITYKKHLKLGWRENFFQFEIVGLDYTDPTKNKFKYILEGYDTEWSNASTVRYISYTELPGGEYTLKIKASNNDGVFDEKALELHITIIPPFWKTIWFYVLTGIFGFGIVILYTQYRTKSIKKINKTLENKVAERTKELAEKNHDITSSIEYARRIQEAILPSKEVIFSSLKNAFILYKPKDIVSGDFYWFGVKNNIKIMAVVDCTGHGVPGAFMSMIGHNLLHQIIQEKGITKPGDILNALHKGVQEALRQGQNEISTNDGMDISLLTINSTNNTVEWAGANRPLILISKTGQLTKFDGNKFPIGGAQLGSERLFTTLNIPALEGDKIYLSSDGYADQFGGEKGKKFMVKRFHELLLSIYTKPFKEQMSILNTNFEDWRKNNEQVDDVLVIGVEI
ncbi:MAG: SpoIIE family protein phosphatase [Bacteroidetes bacterium]|nr:SpoIIE family protein phosphatase [Bacteroidota bacterium]